MIGWSRGGDHIEYKRSNIPGLKAGSKQYYQMSFTHNFTVDECSYFAYSFPYSFTKLERLLDTMKFNS